MCTEFEIDINDCIELKTRVNYFQSNLTLSSGSLCVVRRNSFYYVKIGIRGDYRKFFSPMFGTGDAILVLRHAGSLHNPV